MKEKIYCHICNEQTKYVIDNFSGNHLKHFHKEIKNIQHYYDRFCKKPKEDICPVCGKKNNFKSYTLGYYENCSSVCRNKGENFSKKMQSVWDNRTAEERRKIKNKIAKIKSSMTTAQKKIILKRMTKTKMKKYKDPHYVNMEKAKKTLKNKYGVDNAMKVTQFKLKAQKTCLERYGDIYPIRNKEIQKKGLLKRNKIYEKKLLNLLSSHTLTSKIKLIEYNNINLIKLQCQKNHNFEISKILLRLRIKANVPVCTVCNKKSSFSYKEKELLKFIEKHYTGKILSNDRKIIAPQELDIYLPDLKLAFEYNGLYWHSELYKPANYHLDKTNTCESKGIHLIHIYEDDWILRQDIIESRILNLIHKTENRIFARKCKIDQVDNKTSKCFLDENHIQGNVNSKIKLGLYHDNKLVSLMTFGKARFKQNGFELLRFCNKLNHSVIGGANKLFKYFVNNFYNSNHIISYADRSWSNGALYGKLGFSLMQKSQPNYFYVIDKCIRRNRFNYRKSELIKTGFNKNKTEHDIMLDRNIYRIYDSGNLKYKY